MLIFFFRHSKKGQRQQQNENKKNSNECRKTNKRFLFYGRTLRMVKASIEGKKWENTLKNQLLFIFANSLFLVLKQMA